MAGIGGMGNLNIDLSKVSEEDARELLEFLTVEKTNQELHAQVNGSLTIH